MQTTSEYQSSTDIDVKGYEKKFSDKGFITKVIDAGKKVGRELVEKGYTLYYASKDQDTPGWARTVVYGSLGYFISPIDTIPDFLPGVGFGDDMVVVAAAIAVIAVYIKPIHKSMGQDKADDMFGVESYEATHQSE